VDALQGSVDALIASGRDETVTAVANKFSGSTQKSPRILLRGQKYSIAILTGNETEDEREGLAEDMFLHEGMGCRNVSLVWAPAGTEVDPYLESIAHFRAVFPVHPITSQSLTMSRAFLKATDQPHAFGENLEFLLSKGDPDVQMPGHVRWTEYSKFSDVEQWLGAHSGEIQLVVTSGRRKLEVPETVSVTSPGHSQRPLLDWKSGGADITKFLHDL
jgi:hypothetical protein